MPRSLHLRLLAAVFVALAGSGAASGAELSKEFLEALREAGHVDLALEYLEAREASTPEAEPFRQRIPYERAITLLAKADSLRSGAERTSALERAKRELARFADSSTDPGLSSDALRRIGMADLETGRTLLAQAASASPADQPNLTESAREQLGQAQQSLEKARKLCAEALEAYKSVKPDTPEAQRRLELRGQLAQIDVRRGQAALELSRTFAAGSEDRTKAAQSAAETLAETYAKNGRWTAGFYAHLMEGQAYELAGDAELALATYMDVADTLAEAEASWPLVTLARAYATRLQVAQNDPEQGLRTASGWLESLPPQAQDWPETLALHRQLGAAQWALAKKIGEGAEAGRLQRSARENLRVAAAGPNEFQREARADLVALNAEVGQEAPAPESFAEAYEAGKDAFGAVSALRLGAQLAEGNNQNAVAGLENQTAEAVNEALQLLTAALALADSDTDPVQLNEVRYLLSYLYWEQEDLYRSAVLGDFVARQFPEDPSAPLAARIALASLDRLYREAQASGELVSGGMESTSLTELAGFIARQWPGSPSAESAFAVLLTVLIREDRLEDARDMIATVEPQRRAPLEAKLAAALWERVIAGTSPEQDQSLRAEASAALEASFAASQRTAETTATAATVALYLAQARIETGDAEGAIAVLEHPELGPLTLVSKSAASVDRPGYKVEAYKAALRAYVAVTPPRTEQAEAVMASLEQAVGSGEGAGQRLVQVYLGLSLQLQKQVERLTESGRADEANRVSGAFSRLLDRLQARGDDADWPVQQWIAVTYYGMAEGLQAGGATGDQATEFYGKSRDALQRMLELTSKDPTYAPNEGAVLAARMQLGQCLRRLGEYQRAIEIFDTLLAQRESMLDVQSAAAGAYLDWAVATSDPKLFATAIGGGNPVSETGKNRIWGWSKLAQLTGRVMRQNPKFRDVFFEAWLNIARARCEEAEVSEGDRRVKLLESAERTITALWRQFPELGGEARAAQFDSLLRQAQRSAGKEARGIKSLQAAG